MRRPDVTAIIGRIAQFSLRATGSEHLTYQYSKNSTFILGAVRPSYTTPGTIASDTGAAFTVAVTDATGATATAGAALAVDSAPGVVFAGAMNGRLSAYDALDGRIN